MLFFFSATTRSALFPQVAEVGRRIDHPMALERPTWAEIKQQTGQPIIHGDYLARPTLSVFERSEIGASSHVPVAIL
jgi:hypothetical protein